MISTMPFPNGEDPQRAHLVLSRRGCMAAVAGMVLVGARAARAETPLQPIATDDAELSAVVQKIREAETVLVNNAVSSSIDVFEGGEKKKSFGLVLVNSGDRSVALFRSPVYEEGKIVLLNDGSYFFYFPQPDKYIRISPQNTLFGNVSFGDIVKPPLLAYYDINEAKKSDTHVEIAFTLKEGKSLPYYRKVVSIDAKRNAIERIDSYARSGILLGTTMNLEFQEVNGVLFPSYSRIVDVKRPNSYALQRNSGVRLVDVPPKLFNPSFLSNVDGFVKTHIGF